jgi:hypothetical protein
MLNRPRFALDIQDTAFLQIEHLSILAASRGPSNIPFVARALGCRLSPDIGQVTLFFSAADAREMFAHIAANHMIAAVFALPSTHQALQLKGSDARVEPLRENDFHLVNSYRKAFVGHLEELGFSSALIETLLDCGSSDLAAVTFTPSSAFSQTPGPKAGQAIGGTA